MADVVSFLSTVDTIYGSRLREFLADFFFPCTQNEIFSFSCGVDASSSLFFPPKGTFPFVVPSGGGGGGRDSIPYFFFLAPDWSPSDAPKPARTKLAPEIPLMIIRLCP